MSQEPNWDELYFFCRTKFNMTKEEFLYDHDYELTMDLISRYMYMNNPSENSAPIEEVENVEQKSAREFFSF